MEKAISDDYGLFAFSAWKAKFKRIYLWQFLALSENFKTKVTEKVSKCLTYDLILGI